MASYTKNTNFATKDSLPTGDPAKVVKGTEIDTEYNNLETAVNSKPDANSGTHTGTTSMASVSVSSGLTTADLTATGTSTLTDADVSTLDVTGTATLADMTATGTSTISDADVTTLDVTGTSTLADADITDGDIVTLNVSGDTTLVGDLTVDTSTLHVDSTNNRVGVGTASPSNPLHVSTSSDDPFKITAGSETFTVSMPSGGSRHPELQSSTDTLGLKAGGTRIATADASQNRFNVGVTSSISSSSVDSFVSLATNSTSYFQHNNDGQYLQSWQVSSQSGTGFYLRFEYNGNNEVGSITTDGSTTSYNTSSDYRLKENIQPVKNASTELRRLKPSRFNFIGSDSTKYGFIAHEVQEVVPEAVTGEKDGEEYQGMDASKLIPVLTAALQEALQRIEDLEAKIG